MAKKLPKVIVSALVEKDGKFLLVKEILESGKEYWIIPGGGVEFGESMDEAVKRELKEETGLDIEVMKMIDFHEAVHVKYDYHTIVFLFHAKPLNKGLVLGDKILDAKFFSKNELKDLKLVSSAQSLLEKHFNEKLF